MKTNLKPNKINKITVSVVGLGYVGLPVAVAFGKVRRTIGFDINAKRIDELKAGNDKNNEVSPADLKAANIPQVILAGRRINDSIGKFIAQRTIKTMLHAGNSILGSTITVLGLTFKENCPDLRNSKVVDIIRELEEYEVNIQVCDPMADAAEVAHEYGITLTPLNKLKPASAVILAGRPPKLP